MKYDKVRRNAIQLLSLTGFTTGEFEAFLPTFKYHWDEYYSRFTLTGKQRIRISYNRTTSKIPHIEDKLLFVLSYLKNNPGITQPQCNVWVHLLCEILRKTLSTLGELPDRNHLRVRRLSEQCENVLLDGTERPIERPADEDKQKSCYSGKKNS